MTAEQEKKGKMIRNDRVLAVAIESRTHKFLQSIRDINKELIDDVTDFFTTYHKKRNEQFNVLEIGDSEKAIKLIKKTLKQ